MHQYINLCPPDFLCLVHTLCIVWWKPGWPYRAVCLCPSHLISLPTPCLECVHASVHIFMFTLHLLLAQQPMDSYMESWVPLCVTVFVSQSSCLCFDTLFRMCTCISTWIYVHPYSPWSAPFPVCIVWWKPVCAYVSSSLFVSQSPHACGPTILFRMSSCISTCIYVQPYCPQVCFTPICIVSWSLSVPLYVICVLCPSCLMVLFPHLVWNVYMHQYMYLCLTWLADVW